jgi:hypothetical protein
MTEFKSNEVLGYLRIEGQNDKSFGISGGARLYQLLISVKCVLT